MSNETLTWIFVGLLIVYAWATFKWTILNPMRDRKSKTDNENCNGDGI